MAGRSASRFPGPGDKRASGSGRPRRRNHGTGTLSISGGQRLGEDLGLSSLEQVDLLSQLESQAGVDLDEEQFTALRTIGEIDSWVKKETAVASSRVRAGPSGPHWNRLVALRGLRWMAPKLVSLPLFKSAIDLSVEGLKHLEGLRPPVIFAASHASHLDTPALLAALPDPWQTSLAPAMTQKFFRAYSQPRQFPLPQRVVAAAQYLLACGLFNAYPFSREVHGVRQTLQYTGRLIDEGNCPPLYPEGRRSPDGGMQPFQSGIGFMARRLQMTVAPVRLDGLFDIYSIHHQRPQRGAVRVRIGPTVDGRPEHDYREITREVEAAVRALQGRNSFTEKCEIGIFELKLVILKTLNLERGTWNVTDGPSRCSHSRSPGDDPLSGSSGLGLPGTLFDPSRL